MSDTAAVLVTRAGAQDPAPISPTVPATPVPRTSRFRDRSYISWLAGAAGAAAGPLIGRTPPGATTYERVSVIAPDAKATAAAGTVTCASTSTAVDATGVEDGDGTVGGVAAVPVTTAIPQPPADEPVSFTNATTRSILLLFGSAAARVSVCAVRQPKI